MFLALLLATAQAAAPIPATQAKPEDKVVCKLEEAIYTRIRTKKVCLKQSEWNKIAKDTQDEMNRSANQRGVAPNSDGP
jgi:hypothetical protein